VAGIEIPVEAVGYTGAIFPTVIAWEAIEREKVAVLQVDRTSILIRDIEVRGGW
jgi:hypothetical protein